MKLLLTVEKSTLSTKGGFVNTLVGQHTTTRLGVQKTTKIRFLFKTDAAVTPGTQEEFDLTQFVQVQRSSEVPDRETGELITLTTTWLQEKIG